MAPRSSIQGCAVSKWLLMELKRWVSCSRNWFRNCFDSSAFFKALWILLGISDEIVSTWPYRKQKQQQSDKIFITLFFRLLPSKYTFVLTELKIVNYKLQKRGVISASRTHQTETRNAIHGDVWGAACRPSKHLWICPHVAQHFQKVQPDNTFMLYLLNTSIQKQMKLWF